MTACLRRRLSPFALGLAALGMICGGTALAATRALHSFCCYGDEPYLSLYDNTKSPARGSVYGIATGTFGATGYAFGLVKSSTGYTYQVLYNFCSQTDCSDGANPVGRLIVDKKGNLYGVTISGGLSAQQPDGTVYELIPNADRTQWTRVRLYQFCQATGCSDGLSPPSGLTYKGAASGEVYDGVSPLYGVTQSSSDGHGLVYQLTPPQTGQTGWQEKILYHFCRKTGCTDGDQPGGVVADSSGNLFGFAGDVLFKLDASLHYRETVLHTFCKKANCPDGNLPVDIGLDSSGTLYGVTDQGGVNNNGVLFSYGPNGFSLLHAFGTVAGDGVEPTTVLVTPTGIVYGTTASGGGANGGGMLFSYDSAGLHSVHDFCLKASCTDGLRPHGLTMSAKLLFGTTWYGGGPDGAGAIYSQSLP